MLESRALDEHIAAIIGPDAFHPVLPAFSSSWEAFSTLLEFLDANNYGLSIRRPSPAFPWRAEVNRGRISFEATGATMQEAVCRAFVAVSLND